MPPEKPAKTSYTSNELIKMFLYAGTRTTLYNYEERGTIPKANRVNRGSLKSRAWELPDLPKIGEVIGFIKKPQRPVVISIFSLKGGTGKTTFAFQFARTLALHNLKTLLIGIDAQESLSQTIQRNPLVPKVNPDDTLSLYHIMADGIDPSKAILPTDIPTLRYLPETIELSILDRLMKNQIRREYRIKEKIVDPILSAKDTDVIIVDCTPSWTEVVTGFLACTDILISPLGCDINSLKAAKIFVDLLDEFQTDMKHEFSGFFIVPTMLENTKLSQQILAKYRVAYDQITTTNAIRRAVSVQESNVYGRTLLEVGYKSTAYQDFAYVFKEICALF